MAVVPLKSGRVVGLKQLPGDGGSVPGMVSSAEVEVYFRYRLLGLQDRAADESPPTPHQVGHPWISAGTSYVLLESAEDITMARLRFELWDEQPPPLDQADWPVSEVVRLYLPSGSLAVHEITDYQPDVFDVGAPGPYLVRLAWRPGERWDPEVVKPEKVLLAQFWSDATA